MPPIRALGGHVATPDEMNALDAKINSLGDVHETLLVSDKVDADGVPTFVVSLTSRNPALAGMFAPGAEFDAVFTAAADAAPTSDAPSAPVGADELEPAALTQTPRPDPRDPATIESDIAKAEAAAAASDPDAEAKAAADEAASAEQAATEATAGAPAAATEGAENGEPAPVEL